MKSVRPSSSLVSPLFTQAKDCAKYRQVLFRSRAVQHTIFCAEVGEKVRKIKSCSQKM